MIESITLENFRSFRKKTKFSFIASAERPFGDFIDYSWFNVIKKKKILKAVLLFGDNGAGKSNFLSCVQTLQDLCLEKRENVSEELPFTPFKLSEQTQALPSLIEIIFHTKGICYKYKIRWIHKLILEENLSKRDKKGEDVFVFTRYYNQEHSSADFNAGVDWILSEEQYCNIQSQLIDNVSMLSLLNNQNIPTADLQNVVRYFRNLQIYNLSGLGLIDLFDENKHQFIELKSVVLDILKSVDSNICNFEVREIPIEVPKSYREYVEKMPASDEKKEMLERLANATARFVDFYHKTDEREEPFRLSEEEESDGTLEMIKLIILLYMSIKNHVPVAIDECPQGIHINAFKRILQFFLAASEYGQIIMSSQAAYIMGLRGYRRDSTIFFIKDNKTGISNTSTVDLRMFHKNLNMYDQFAAGKLTGVVPFADEETWGEKLLEIRKKLNSKTKQ